MASISGSKKIITGLCMAAALGASGCFHKPLGFSYEVGGQMLPSPYYLSDDVQYFAPGPEFPLAREAATQQVRQAENAAIDDQFQPGE